MHPRVPTLRPVVLGVLLAGLLLAGAALLPGDRTAGRDRAPADRTAAIGVLRAWDRDRAAAWREGDLDALADLYVAGSRAGRADRAMLAAYVDRGLRVTGMRMQLAAAELVRHDDDRLVLLVTDRLSGATAVGAGVRRALPHDGWSRRRVVLVADGSRWRVASVSDQASPEANTEATSGSSNR